MTFIRLNIVFQAEFTLAKLPISASRRDEGGILRYSPFVLGLLFLSYKGMDFEMPSLSDKHIQRLKEYLLSIGWTKKQILDLIDYIAK